MTKAIGVVKGTRTSIERRKKMKSATAIVILGVCFVAVGGSPSLVLSASATLMPCSPVPCFSPSSTGSRKGFTLKG